MGRQNRGSTSDAVINLFLREIARIHQARTAQVRSEHTRAGEISMIEDGIA